MDERTGFWDPMGTGRVLDVCLCFGCSDVGGVCGEWGLYQGLEGGMVLCLRDL